MAARSAAGPRLRPLRLVPGRTAARAAPPGPLRRLAAGLAAGLRSRAGRPPARDRRPRAPAGRGHRGGGLPLAPRGRPARRGHPRAARPRWPSLRGASSCSPATGSADLSRFDLAGSPARPDRHRDDRARRGAHHRPGAHRRRRLHHLGADRRPAGRGSSGAAAGAARIPSSRQRWTTWPRRSTGPA